MLKVMKIALKTETTCFAFCLFRATCFFD